MEFLPQIALALVAYVIATASPGPAVLGVMMTSATEGRRAGLAFSAGVLSGSVFWGIVAGLGMTAVMAQFAWALEALKLFGGLYLLWLGWKSWRSALSATAPAAGGADDVAPVSVLRHYRTGLLLHLGNPKAVMAWIAVMTLGLSHDAPAWVAAVILLSCFVLGNTVFIGYALLFSTRRSMRLFNSARRTISAIAGTCFALAGVKLMTARL